MDDAWFQWLAGSLLTVCTTLLGWVAKHLHKKARSFLRMERNQARLNKSHRRGLSLMRRVMRRIDTHERRLNLHDKEIQQVKSWIRDSDLVVRPQTSDGAEHQP